MIFDWLCCKVRQVCVNYVSNWYLLLVELLGKEEKFINVNDKHWFIKICQGLTVNNVCVFRQERNRDAAFRSRERKKLYVKELEMKSKYFEEECKRLGMMLNCVAAENHALRLSLQTRTASDVSRTKQESAVLFLGITYKTISIFYGSYIVYKCYHSICCNALIFYYWDWLHCFYFSSKTRPRVSCSYNQ